MVAIVLAIMLPMLAVRATAIAAKASHLNPAARMAAILAAQKWHRLKSHFFCYEKSPLLTHGFASGGTICLKRSQRVRYAIQWPTPAVYLLDGKRLFACRVGHGWKRIKGASGAKIAYIMGYFATLGSSPSAKALTRWGRIALSHRMLPKPPRRDVHYAPAPTGGVWAFSLIPRLKAMRAKVSKIRLFFDRHSDFLAAIEIHTRQGAVTYWFSRTAINPVFPLNLFKPVGPP